MLPVLYSVLASTNRIKMLTIYTTVDSEIFTVNFVVYFSSLLLGSYFYILLSKYLYSTGKYFMCLILVGKVNLLNQSLEAWINHHTHALYQSVSLPVDSRPHSSPTSSQSMPQSQAFGCVCVCIPEKPMYTIVNKLA